MSVGQARFRCRRWVVGAGGVLVLLGLVFWRPLHQECLAWFLLRSEAPAEEALSELVKQAGDPQPVLQRLWSTQRIAHRHFVLRYLGSISSAKPDLFRALEPVSLEATGDVDLEARQLAFAALASRKHPDLRRLSCEQLADTDPAVRLLGLQNLRRVATTNDVPISMRLLDDPEPRIVVAAAQVLREATGQDFGLRSAHAVPQFTYLGTNPPPPPDLTAISQGVGRCRDWWSRHQAEYPAPTLPLPPPRRLAPLATPDFALEDSAGTPVHLSTYRGRVVLLAFWSLDAPANLDMELLNRLQQRHPERLAILGICIPAAPSCADEHHHGEGHDHGEHSCHEDASSAPLANAAPTRASVQAEKQLHHLNYPMLLDAKGIIGLRFDVEDRPTYVLLDAQGRILRRFVGNRTEPILHAFIQEAEYALPANRR
ncbi:MAG TPA: redoxin domain-containing protein [Candidatus Sulfotelmatobacter sp.]|nr:redoxin domain-containing protein [Candidatus Sulfotelmatobacter sp.]